MENYSPEQLQGCAAAEPGSCAKLKFVTPSQKGAHAHMLEPLTLQALVSCSNMHSVPVASKPHTDADFIMLLSPHCASRYPCLMAAALMQLLRGAPIDAIGVSRQAVTVSPRKNSSSLLCQYLAIASGDRQPPHLLLGPASLEHLGGGPNDAVALAQQAVTVLKEQGPCLLLQLVVHKLCRRLNCQITPAAGASVVGAPRRRPP